jgi:hypothetical protein
MAYPGRVFEGKISKMGAIVDPNTAGSWCDVRLETPKMNYVPECSPAS